MKKRIVSLVIALSLISAPMYAYSVGQGEFDPTGKTLEVAWDILAVRPLSYVGMAAAAIIYLPAALFTLLAGQEIEPVQDALLKKPYEYAVKRPLGQFDY